VIGNLEDWEVRTPFGQGSISVHTLSLQLYSTAVQKVVISWLKILLKYTDSNGNFPQFPTQPPVSNRCFVRIVQNNQLFYITRSDATHTLRFSTAGVQSASSLQRQVRFFLTYKVTEHFI